MLRVSLQTHPPKVVRSLTRSYISASNKFRMLFAIETRLITNSKNNKPISSRARKDALEVNIKHILRTYLFFFFYVKHSLLYILQDPHPYRSEDELRYDRRCQKFVTPSSIPRKLFRSLTSPFEYPCFKQISDTIQIRDKLSLEGALLNNKPITLRTLKRRYVKLKG